MNIDFETYEGLVDQASIAAKRAKDNEMEMKKIFIESVIKTFGKKNEHFLILQFPKTSRFCSSSDRLMQQGLKWQGVRLNTKTCLKLTYGHIQLYGVNNDNEVLYNSLSFATNEDLNNTYYRLKQMLHKELKEEKK